MNSLIFLMGQGFTPDLSNIPDIALGIGTMIVVGLLAMRLIDFFWPEDPK